MENESQTTHKVDIRLRKYGNDHHPRLIIEDLENRYVAIPITHEKKKNPGRINYKLQTNPMGEDRPAYIRRAAEIRKKNQYGPVIYVATICDRDYKKLKSLAQKAIDKYNHKK